MEIGKSLDNIIKSCNNNMDKSLEHFKKTFSNFRCGNISSNILSKVIVTYQGYNIYLNEMSSIYVIDSMTLCVKPWEKLSLPFIYKAILKSNIDVIIVKNVDKLIIKFPIITQETRKNIVKKLKLELEKTKISLRKIRKNINNSLKNIDGLSEDLFKRTEKSIQNITNSYIKKADYIFSLKEKEIINI